MPHPPPRLPLPGLGHPLPADRLAFSGRPRRDTVRPTQRRCSETGSEQDSGLLPTCLACVSGTPSLLPALTQRLRATPAPHRPPCPPGPDWDRPMLATLQAPHPRGCSLPRPFGLWLLQLKALTQRSYPRPVAPYPQDKTPFPGKPSACSQAPPPAVAPSPGISLACPSPLRAGLRDTG